MPDLVQTSKIATPPMPVDSSAGNPAVTAPQSANDTDDLKTPSTISTHKESEPSFSSPSENSPAETTKPEIEESAPPEIKIPHELKGIVEKSPEEDKIPIGKDISLAGVIPSAESTPVITTPTGTIKMPMTYIQALQKTRNTKLMDSAHWLAELIMYEWTKYEPDLVKESKHNRSNSK